jgi:predicted unusual protein kinase regulating ubiquinone biosynthesis (AarF/ABC1/UbiB family)
MPSQRRITSSRLGRLGQLGRLAGGLAGGALTEGARQLSRGKRPALEDVLLTPGNVGRLAERLSEMRGAAMKVGQLLSMDSGEVLPPQLSALLQRLREDAHRMPLGQVAAVMRDALGEDWQHQFARFAFDPIAAASIGQVHRARLRDGRDVAVKVQYPGIRRSIDSDVDNVAGLLRLFRILPPQLDLDTLFDEAKAQLHVEADYRHEAEAIAHFTARVGDDRRFELPRVVPELSCRDVLTMDFLDGAPIEQSIDYAPADRHAIAMHMTELSMVEVFDWGYVQTDPNFANYLVAPDRRTLQLLDFGATRAYNPSQTAALRDMLAACLDGGDDDIAAAAAAVGYVGDGDPHGYRDAVVALLRLATAPARTPGDYRFGDDDLARRMADAVVEMRLKQGYSRLPPTEILFLHRKLGGLYLLLARLRARLPIARLTREVIDRALQTPGIPSAASA